MKQIAVGSLGDFWYGDYKEPLVQLEGAIPGYPRGTILKDTEGKLLCPYCGRTWDNLGVHAYHKHGLQARAFKEEVGLLQKSALVSETERIRRIRTALGNSQLWKASLKDAQQLRAASAGRAASTIKASGRHTPEHLNKTGRCYEQVLAVGRTVLRERGGLTESGLRKHGIGPLTVRRYFGDWSGFRKAVGAPDVKFRRWTDAVLLDSLKKLAQTLGRTPTRSDLRRFGLPSPHAYSGHFGSYIKACTAAGLTPNLPIARPGDFSQEILTAYAAMGSIRRVSEHFHVKRAYVERVLTSLGMPPAGPFIPGRGRDDRRRLWAAEAVQLQAAVA